MSLVILFKFLIFCVGAVLLFFGFRGLADGRDSKMISETAADHSADSSKEAGVLPLLSGTLDTPMRD